MLHCKLCKMVKPMDCFYASNQSACKDCYKAQVRKHRAEKADHYRAYDKARAMAPNRVAMREAYQSTEAGKGSVTRAKKRYQLRNPVKRKTHNLVNSAIQTGKLHRQPCEICGAAKAHAHHDDYTKPLEVRWLCPAHHRQWHVANGEAKTGEAT